MAFEPDEYTRRVLRARRVHLAVDQEILGQMQALLDSYADDLARLVRYLPDTGVDTQRSIAIRRLRRLTADLERRVSALTERGVKVQFSDIRRAMDQATMRAIRDAGSPVPFVPRPPLLSAQAFLARRGTADAFRSLSLAVEGAGRGAEDIILEGLSRGWGREHLARKLRPFVKGREVFTPEELHDLRRVPKSRRDEVRLLQYNTRRIAVTEMGNAAHEAQAQAMIDAPMILAARWRLSPVRGTQEGKPDECDILAVQDFYGLGAGIYPVRRIPVRPHPNDKCWLQDVTRPVEQWNDPKPNPSLQAKPGIEGLDGLTPPAQERAIASARLALQNGIQADRMRQSELRRIARAVA